MTDKPQDGKETKADPESAPKDYVRSGSKLLYRTKNKNRDHFQVRTEAGWEKPSAPLSSWLEKRVEKSGTWMTAEEAAGYQRRAFASEAKPQTATKRSIEPRVRFRTSLLRFKLSPPLGYGAPRFLNADVTKVARDHYVDRLGEENPERTEEEAREGWKQGRDRIAGIEQRAGYLLGAAGVGGAFLLAGSGLLIGDRASLEGVPKDIAVAGLMLVVLGLSAATAYASAAVMWAFGRAAPDITKRVLERSKQPDHEARKAHSAALMVSRKRASDIGAWKLARLKRAAAGYGLAVVGVLLALVAVVAQAFTGS